MHPHFIAYSGIAPALLAYLSTLAPGDPVYWHDPDGDVASGVWRIASSRPIPEGLSLDDRIDIVTDAGSEATVPARELCPVALASTWHREGRYLRAAAGVFAEVTSPPYTEPLAIGRTLAAAADLRSALESVREFMQSALQDTEHDANWRHFDALAGLALALAGPAPEGDRA